MMPYPLALPSLVLLFAGATPFGETAVPGQGQDEATSPPRLLALKDVVEIATERAHEVRILEQARIAAEERVAATRAQYFPRVRAEGNALVWDSSLDVAFAPPGMEVPDAAKVTVRDQFTANLTVTVGQPISGLYALTHLLALEKRGLEAAEADNLRGQLDAAYRAVEAFLRLLQADALSQVAKKSVAQVEANLLRARTLESAGVLGRVDVLRLESAYQTALQASLRAEGGATIGARALLLTLDLPLNLAIVTKDDLPDPPPSLRLSPEQASALAVRNRPELLAADRRVAQAEKGPAVALTPILPSLTAVGSYQHSEGQSTFQPKDAFFAGGTLTWDVWDWGKAFDDADEASARAEQARIARDLTAQQVTFDAERCVIEARLAFDSLRVAKTGLAAAEEAQRIQAARFAQGEATTTDVLDTETELARAQANYAALRYDYYITLAAALRAIGRLPEAGALSSGVDPSEMKAGEGARP